MTYTFGEEVANFPSGSQFEGGESSYLCVFFCVAAVAASSEQGRPVGQSWEWVDQTADRLVNDIQGQGSFKTSEGASLQDEYSALQRLNLSYAHLPTKASPGDSSTLDAIRKAVYSGAVVLLCGSEEGFIDEKTGKVPYTWKPTGNHCIIVSGIAPNLSLIVRDYAATGNSWLPGTPRTYKPDTIQAVSATAVYPYWKGTTTMSGVPNGWKDNGETLTAPNGQTVVMGFRKHIMESEWDPTDWPNEHEYNVGQVLLHNASVGGGDRQTTVKHMLWWTKDKGVVEEPNLGLELSAAYKQISSLQTTGFSPQSLFSVLLKDTRLVVESLSSQQAASSGSDSPVVSALTQLLSDLESLSVHIVSQGDIPLPPPPTPH